jgi:ribosomal protein L11 methyltransferase
VIDPKMAFGTGHHETTSMMVEAMEEIDFKGKRVFDFGCGTGVLAILARKLGAEEVLAIDYDPASTENTIENVQLNKVEPVEVLEGTLDVVPHQLFAVILANINRNVLMDTLPDLKTLLEPGGLLLLSGILIRDQPLLLERAAETGLIFESAQTKGDWCMLRFRG